MAQNFESRLRRAEATEREVNTHDRDSVLRATNEALVIMEADESADIDALMFGPSAYHDRFGTYHAVTGVLKACLYLTRPSARRFRIAGS